LNSSKNIKVRIRNILEFILRIQSLFYKCRNKFQFYKCRAIFFSSFILRKRLTHQRNKRYSGKGDLNLYEFSFLQIGYILGTAKKNPLIAERIIIYFLLIFIGKLYPTLMGL